VHFAFSIMPNLESDDQTEAYFDIVLNHHSQFSDIMDSLASLILTLGEKIESLPAC
jgi:hypothetical protein